MQAGLRNKIRGSLAALIVVATCLATFAQQPPLDDLARWMAASLEQAKQKNVAVLSFVGPDETEAWGKRSQAIFMKRW